MSQQLSGLAAAFRQAVAREEAERKQQQDLEKKRAQSNIEAEATRKAAAQAARVALITELSQFAQALGDVKVNATKSGLSMTRGSHTVTFQADGDEDRLALTAATLDGSHIERDVAGDWLLCLRLGDKIHYRQLVTDGLEEIMVHGLGYPRPQTQSESTAPAEAAPRAAANANATTLRADPEARATVDPKRPSPGSTAKDLTDPFA